MALVQIIGLLFLFLPVVVSAAAEEVEEAQQEQEVPVPTLGDDGLWVAEWLNPTTGDLRSDLAVAAHQGRILAVFWEHPRCKFCAEMHLVALQRPELRGFFTGPLYAVRLQRFGEEEIVDLDGVRRSERDVSLRHGVLGTPTIEFRLADGTEVFRIPGSAEPAILQAAFEYVTRGGYLHTTFVKWLLARRLL